MTCLISVFAAMARAGGQVVKPSLIQFIIPPFPIPTPTSLKPCDWLLCALHGDDDAC